MGRQRAWRQAYDMVQRQWMRRQLVLAVLTLVISLPGCGYNRMVDLQEQVKAAWAQVENQLQRRADLIPNLVNVVKGYAAHERELFQHIADARAALLGATTVDEKIEASRHLETALQPLFV